MSNDFYTRVNIQYKQASEKQAWMNLLTTGAKALWTANKGLGSGQMLAKGLNAAKSYATSAAGKEMGKDMVKGLGQSAAQAGAYHMINKAINHSSGNQGQVAGSAPVNHMKAGLGGNFF